MSLVTILLIILIILAFGGGGFLGGGAYRGPGFGLGGILLPVLVAQMTAILASKGVIRYKTLPRYPSPPLVLHSSRQL